MTSIHGNPLFLSTMVVNGWQENSVRELGQKGMAIGLAIILHGMLIVPLLIKPTYELPVPVAVNSFEFVMLPITSPVTTEKVEPVDQQELSQSDVIPTPTIEPITPTVKKILPIPDPVTPPVEPISQIAKSIATPLPAPISSPRRKPPPEIIPVKEEVTPHAEKAVEPFPRRLKTAERELIEEPIAKTKPATGKTTTAKAIQEQFTAPIGKANFLRNPKPVYPILARRRGIQGLVLLNVDVDPNGYPLAVTIKRGSGHKILDRSALRTVQKWRFVPAKRWGIAVRASVEIPIRFSLVNS